MYGARIKKYLDKNGIKYSYLANETGIALNVISAMLNCKRKITVDEYFKICTTLKVEASYFSEPA
jgi:transcriptional regulator with XRE-family HTH domain